MNAMRINLTFVIQVANFMVTYFVLNRYIFKPVLKTINNRKITKEKLEDQIEKHEAEIINAEENKQRMLYRFQSRARRKYYIPKKPFISLPSDIQYSRSKENIRSLTEKIKGLILKEIPRVR